MFVSESAGTKTQYNAIFVLKLGSIFEGGLCCFMHVVERKTCNNGITTIEKPHHREAGQHLSAHSVNLQVLLVYLHLGSLQETRIHHNPTLEYNGGDGSKCMVSRNHRKPVVG